MSFGAPTPPSPSQGIALGGQVAGQQQQLNTQAGLQSQQGSMVNQFNPYGSLQYVQTGVGPNGAPQYSATASLSPQQQQLLAQLTGTQTTAGGQAGSLLSGANYGSQSPAQAVGNMSTGLEGQIMAGYQQEMQPIQQTQRAQLDTQLRNQGLQPGEPGYDNAIRQYDTNVNNANAAAASNYAQTAFNQANTLYGEPLSMSESLAKFGAPTLPNQSFVNAPGLNIQPANLIGATASQQQALQQQYDDQMKQYSGMMNGLFGIGSDALGIMTGGMSTPFTSMMSGGFGGGGGMSDYGPGGSAFGAVPQMAGNGVYYPSFPA